MKKKIFTSIESSFPVCEMLCVRKRKPLVYSRILLKLVVIAIVCYGLQDETCLIFDGKAVFNFSACRL